MSRSMPASSASTRWASARSPPNRLRSTGSKNSIALTAQRAIGAAGLEEQDGGPVRPRKLDLACDELDELLARRDIG